MFSAYGFLAFSLSLVLFEMPKLIAVFDRVQIGCSVIVHWFKT